MHISTLCNISVLNIFVLYGLLMSADCVWWYMLFYVQEIKYNKKYKYIINLILQNKVVYLTSILFDLL